MTGLRTTALPDKEAGPLERLARGIVRDAAEAWGRQISEARCEARLM